MGRARPKPTPWTLEEPSPWPPPHPPRPPPRAQCPRWPRFLGQLGPRRPPQQDPSPPGRLRGLRPRSWSGGCVFSCSERGLWCEAFSSCSTRAQDLRLAGLEGLCTVTHRLSCPEVRRVFLGQRSNPCPLHWQAGSHPLDHRGNFIIRFPFLPAPESKVSLLMEISCPQTFHR